MKNSNNFRGNLLSGQDFDFTTSENEKEEVINSFSPDVTTNDSGTSVPSPAPSDENQKPGGELPDSAGETANGKIPE